MTARATTKKGSAKKNSNGFMSTKAGIVTGSVLIFAILVGIVFTLNSLRSLPETKLNAKTKQTTTNTEQPKRPVDIQTYDYTKILENKELDTGSGVKITRNYEAETAKKEAAYRKELERKRREKREALEAKARREAEIKQQALEKRRLAEEKKRQQQLVKNSPAGANTPVLIQPADRQKANGKFYIQCGSDNFRTAKEAEGQKAKLAFTGKQSAIVLKQMGGGYVYSLSIGPYNSLDEAVKARNEIVNANLARNCSAIK